MGEISMNEKITSFKVYDDDEQKTLISDNDLNKILEVLENNGYIVEVKYKQNQTIEKTINH
jgi:ribosomal protein S8